jgi:hypothetical protein
MIKPGSEPPGHCPKCDKALVEVGDQGRYLECVCGYRFDTYLSRETIEEPEPEPVTWDQIADALSLTIKKDNPSKIITFAALVLAKTEEDQINLGFQAESAAGKTYIPLEVASHFPQEDVVVLAGASPTSFFHEYGQWDDKRKVSVVNLEEKVLIFLDFPDYRLIEKLRPLLSHDRKTLVFKITDKKEKQGLRTKTVEIVGFPIVIFCSTKLNPDEQEKTRLLLLSPEIDQEKLEASLRLIALKVADRAAYQKLLESDPKRRWLEELAKKTWSSGIKNVKIESDLYTRFVQTQPKHKPRHQRDLPRVASLIKAHAMINWQLREMLDDKTIVTTEEDVDAGFSLYAEVSQANELGISPYVMRIYEDVVRPILSNAGISRKEIYQSHYSAFGRTANQQWYEKEIFPALTATGLIIEEADPEDRRRKLVYPPDLTMVIDVRNPKSGAETSQSHIDNHSGVRGVSGQEEGQPLAKGLDDRPSPQDNQSLDVYHSEANQ